ncbi:MAG TPA: hypothetical protein VKV77_11180 [Methylovirgula sp.]|nr:hypothetical protein [Methylovirgula sp.]
MIPYDSEPDEAFKAAAVAMIRAGLGEAELGIVASYTTPFYWVLRYGDGCQEFRGGSLFFLDTSRRIFGVTASHVVEACLEDTKSSAFVQCMIGSNGKVSLPFMLGDRIIDAHHDIDIATLDFSAQEIAYTGRGALRGSYPTWPPPIPQEDRGVLYCGFPGKGRRVLKPAEINFGCVAMAGLASNCRETSLSILIERQNMEQILGDEAMPEDYDFGGISGGPVIAIVQSATMRSWRPAGVIIQGPNPSGVEGESIAGLEIIKVRPIHFIKEDGFIDVARWEQNFF